MKKIGIITGASSGLGAEFARKVAGRAGLEELWLVARRKQRLDELAGELEGVTGIGVPLDLTDAKAVENLGPRLTKEKADVRLLINCAGYGDFGAFSEGARDDQVGMVNINVGALTRMTHLCLPFMSAGARIINVASMAAYGPIPGFAVYGATKAYVLSFSHALRSELKSRDINVLAVCPGPVDTEFLDLATEDDSYRKLVKVGTVPPGPVVAKALRDSDSGRAESVYGASIKLTKLLQGITPRGLQSSVLRGLIKK